MAPLWIHLLSMASLSAGFVCAAWIMFDEFRRPQPMWIMNIVWPLAALFGGVLTAWLYHRYRRSGKNDTPHSIMVAKATLHCGSGCTLGDICAEWLAFAFPAMAVWLGWQSAFSNKIFAVWIWDYIFAYAFGILFQYFTIAPARHLGIGEGLKAAVKADTLSLTAWQIGMYGFMALAHFWAFPSLFKAELQVNSVEFWFMMQLAMLCGFITSYPMNGWLLRHGLKEAM